MLAERDSEKKEMKYDAAVEICAIYWIQISDLMICRVNKLIIRFPSNSKIKYYVIQGGSRNI